ATIALGSLIAMFVLGDGHLVSDLLNPFDTSSAQRRMVVVSVFLTLAISILVRRATSSGLRIPSSISSLARFSYTLYVIHYPLLLLSFSLLHPMLHNHSWMTSLVVAMTILAPIAYISSSMAIIVENRVLLRHL